MDVMLIGITVMAAATCVAAFVRLRRPSAPALAGGLVAGSYHRQASVAVGRAELARLARHPLLWLGAAGSATLAGVLAGDEVRFAAVGGGLIPFAALTFAAVHLSVSRDRRAGSAELTASLPVGWRSRTVGHLLAAPVVALAGGLAWVGVALARTGGGGQVLIDTWHHRDVPWTPSAVELVQPFALLLMAVALAVLVGTWMRHPALAFFVPLVLFFSPVMWFFPPVVEGGLIDNWATGELVTRTASQVGWHLAYLAGVAALAVAGALARHDRRWPVAALATAGAVATSVGIGLGPLPTS